MAMLTKEPDSVQVVHRPSFGPTLVTRRGTYDLDADTPACEAIRVGLPVLLGSLDEIRTRYPALLAEIEEAGLGSRASLPLHSATGATFGAIGFGWPGPQEFKALQLRRLDLIAQLVGLALERAMKQQSESGQGEQLPSILETMPNAFFSLDADLTITSLNAEAERLLGRSRTDVLGRRLLSGSPEAASAALDGSFRHAIESGEPVVFEEFFAPFDGWFEVHAWPDREGLNVYFSDVSERRNSEFAQSVALDEARQAHARLTFVADVSTRLHGAATRTELFERLSRAVITYMADWCTVVVPSGEELIRVAAAHRDPILDGLAKRLVGGYPHPFSGPSPGVVVYRSGEPLRLRRLAQQIVTDLDDSIASAAYGRTLRLLGDGPGLIMPIYFNGEVVAVLTMVRSGGERFGDADIATMTQVTATVADLLDDAVHLETQRETASALQAAALPRTLPTFGPPGTRRRLSRGKRRSPGRRRLVRRIRAPVRPYRAGRRRCRGSRSSGGRSDDPDEKRPTCPSVRLLRPIGVDRQIEQFHRDPGTRGICHHHLRRDRSGHRRGHLGLSGTSGADSPQLPRECQFTCRGNRRRRSVPPTPNRLSSRSSTPLRSRPATVW